MYDWTFDELTAYSLNRLVEPTPNPWATLGTWAAIALGIPLAVLVLGASLVVLLLSVVQKIAIDGVVL